MSTTLIHAVLAGLLLALAGTAYAALRWRTAYRHAQWRAEHDHLTGLPTRVLADRHLASHTIAATVAMVDLDNFKSVNDSYGHDIGDRVLVEVAHRLSNATDPDIGQVYRLAGDEFLVVWWHWYYRHHADTQVAMLLDQLAAPLPLPGTGTVVVHATAGIATSGAHWPQPLREADIALYHARDTNRRHATYHPGMTFPTAAAARHGPRLRDHRPHPPAAGTGN